MKQPVPAKKWIFLCALVSACLLPGNLSAGVHFGLTKAAKEKVKQIDRKVEVRQNKILSRPSTSLKWTEEANYTSGAVNPWSGPPGTVFTFRVMYTNGDNYAPAYGYPKIHIKKDGFEIEGSPFTISEADPVDTVCSDGKIYVFSRALGPGSGYSHYFEAQTANGQMAGGAPTGLSTGPIVGFAPVLSWTGEVNYVSDGLDPETGTTGANFVYRVRYSDADNDAPASGYPKVHIKNGAAEIDGSPFAMTYVSGDYSTGAVYTYSGTFVSPGSGYSHYFEAQTANGQMAGGAPTGLSTGPIVGFAPVLSWTGEVNYVSDGLDPETGTTGANFVYRVRYSDADNDAPASGYPKVHIKNGAAEIDGSPFAMTYVSGDYSTGAVYTYSGTFVSPGSGYSYFFEARDLYNQVSTGTPVMVKYSPMVGCLTPDQSDLLNLRTHIRDNTAYLLGDVDFDGVVALSDARNSEAALSALERLVADTNNDGSVSESDAEKTRRMAQGLEAPVNLDTTARDSLVNSLSGKCNVAFQPIVDLNGQYDKTSLIDASDWPLNNYGFRMGYNTASWHLIGHYDEKDSSGNFKLSNTAQYLKPQLLRFPGGTESNYFDWKSESYSTNLINKAPQEKFLEQILRPVGAEPLFVLNVQEYSSSSTVLNQYGQLNREYLLDWVKYRRSKENSYGAVPVRQWQLGNEINWHEDLNHSGLQPGQEYVLKSATIGYAIQNYDPNLKVIAHLFGPIEASNVVVSTWNSRRAEKFDNNVTTQASPGSGRFFNAVSIHNYICAKPAPAQDAADIDSRCTDTYTDFDWFIQSGDDFPSAVHSWANKMSLSDIPIQITESGVLGNWQPHWAHMFAGVNAILQLAVDHKNIEAVYKHHFCDGLSSGSPTESFSLHSWVPMACTDDPLLNPNTIHVNPAGEIHKFILQRLHEGGTVRKMAAAGNFPAVPGKYYGDPKYPASSRPYRTIKPSYPGLEVFKFTGSANNNSYIILNRQAKRAVVQLPGYSAVKYKVLKFSGLIGEEGPNPVKPDPANPGLYVYDINADRKNFNNSATRDEELSAPGGSLFLLNGYGISLIESINAPVPVF